MVMIAIQVLGEDTAIVFAGSQGNLDLKYDAPDHHQQLLALRDDPRGRL
jgi:fumarate hydratase class II